MEDVESHLTCYQLRLENIYGGQYPKELPSLWALWSEMQQAAARDQAVIAAHKKVMACLAERGYAEVDSGLLFFWQDFQSPEDYRAKLTSYTLMSAPL